MNRRVLTLIALSQQADLAGLPEGFNVQLLPWGEFRAVDGRPAKLKAWRFDEAAAQAVLDGFNGRKTELVIDYDHQTQAASSNGQPAPAAGWIKALHVVPGRGLFARVEWTERAAALIAAKEYRYISPVIQVGQDGHVVRLLMAGLVNAPALDALAEVSLSRVFGETFNPSTNPNNGVPSMDLLAALRAALGLASDATEQTALTAVTALKAKVDTHATEVETLKAKAFDATKHVTLEDHAKVSTELAALKASALEAEVGALVETALKANKLSPAQKDWALGLGRASLESLKSFLAAAPEIAPGQTQSKGKPTDAAALDVNDAQAVSLKAGAYIKEQFALGRVVSASEAVNHVIAEAQKAAGK